jgi:hypothetical protein
VPLRATAQQRSAKSPRSNSSKYRSSITSRWARMQRMPRSAWISSSPDRQSIAFECTEFNNQKHSGRYPRRRDGPLFFNIHQWERQTASIKRQRSIPSVLTASLNQWELFIYLSPFRSFISATKSIMQCGINVGNMGRHMDMALISPLNREIATASPVNHNEATSGSVNEEIALHLRRVLG